MMAGKICRAGLRLPIPCPSITAAIVLLILICMAGTALSEVSRLDMLKAAFIVNFAKFTTWPPEKAPDEALYFCIEQSAIAPQAFDDWTSQSLKGAAVRPRFISEAGTAAVADCHVLVLGKAGAPPPEPELRELARRHHVLLVSTADGFTEAGGHIGLFIVDNRLKFSVNLEAVRRGGLSLSSQLLRLAESVKS